MSKKKLKTKSKIFERVFVLGGSSEIANEICKNLVRAGTKKIHLVLRDKKKKDKILNDLSENYPVEISFEEIDLFDIDANFYPSIDFYDLYIVAIGYLGLSKLANESIQEATRIAKINYFSLIPWIMTIASEKRIQKPGALWILSSVSGDIGRPSNYHYGAAKSALSILCQGIFYRCQNKPFKVRIIKAGLIDTKMSKGMGPKILYTSKKYLTNSLLNNMNKEGIEYLPWWWFVIMKFIKILPKKIVAKL